MCLGLIEAFIMLHLEHRYICGSREVDGLGRGRAEDTRLVAILRFFGRLRTHVALLDARRRKVPMGMGW